MSCWAPLRRFEEDVWLCFDDTPGVLQVNVRSYVFLQVLAALGSCMVWYGGFV